MTLSRLPADHEIACFRVVQEAITNVLRHAAARRIDVHMARSATHVSLSIRDDGRGFDPATLDAAALAGANSIVTDLLLMEPLPQTTVLANARAAAFIREHLK